MSALIRVGEVLVDDWTALEDETPLPSAGKIIVSWKRWNDERTALLASGLSVGLRLPNTLDVDAVAAELVERPLLALHFPSFADGRAYSQATILSTRHHYCGELRAVGNAVVRDQLQQLYSCGFNTFELRSDQDPELCARSFKELSLSYQPRAITNIRSLRFEK